MLAGGISEAIMHFVGYLRIIDDIARDRIEYDGSSQRPSPDDYLAKHPVFDGKFDPDDIEISAVRSPRPIAPEELQWPGHHPPKLPHAPPIDMPERLDPAGLPPGIPSPGGGGGGGGVFFLQPEAKATSATRTIAIQMTLHFRFNCIISASRIV